MKTAVFWFRRDLRLDDNKGLNQALRSDKEVLPIFIFDPSILDELPKNDARVSFIYHELQKINEKLVNFESALKIYHAEPLEAWKMVVHDFDVDEVFYNSDYEPYARSRDKKVQEFLSEHGIAYTSVKDQVIFEQDEVLKGDGTPYTVYTPYKNKWITQFNRSDFEPEQHLPSTNFKKLKSTFPELTDIGFEESTIKIKPYSLTEVAVYGEKRDFPAEDAGSYLAPHLRFGTVSVRRVIQDLGERSAIFLSELIWREFFTQIIYHFPRVVSSNFKTKYDGIVWRNDEDEFKKWCEGKTGYPFVDAGMRQLNETGYMHNRVRMITASFLCKHLLIDWRWGEAYFAQKLLDFDLAANNGNWQWASGTGCDSAPYFRIFNPTEQVKKFDKALKYIKNWIPELNSLDYPAPVVDHKFARERCLKVYKDGIRTI